jgi:hypothetical protein
MPNTVTRKDYQSLAYSVLLTASLAAAFCTSISAAQANGKLVSGSFRQSSSQTNGKVVSGSFRQSPSQGLASSSTAPAPTTRNGLPPTNLDSFVRQAQSAAEFIYGDEGVYTPPPYSGFSKASRINAGIFDTRDAGLTTGHGTKMPDAWGADEFIMPPNGEWSLSGARGVTASNGPVDGTPAMTDFSPDDGSYGANSTANLPPSPGPGYQPIFQHGVFVGYMSPDLIALMQTDPTDAWTEFANSPEFVGPEGLRLSLLAETGAATPAQQAELESMALYGL